MKALITIASFVAAQVAFANPFADITNTMTFKGTGDWKINTQSQKGNYNVTTDITKLNEGQYRVNTTLVFPPQETAMVSTMSFNFTKDGFFNVLGEDATTKIGEGYCFEAGDQGHTCHYHAHLDGNKVMLEETIALMGGKLYRLGSKHFMNDSHSTVAWTDKEEIQATK